MRLSKFFIFMFFLTMLSLVYIQLQVQIFDLAYQGRTKQNTIRKLIDDNGDVTYNICKLESANHLGVRLLEKDSDMQFLSQESIVRFQIARLDGENRTSPLSAKPERRPNLLASIFSLKSQAEAEPIR